MHPLLRSLFVLQRGCPHKSIEDCQYYAPIRSRRRAGQIASPSASYPCLSSSSCPDALTSSPLRMHRDHLRSALARTGWRRSWNTRPTLDGLTVTRSIGFDAGVGGLTTQETAPPRCRSPGTPQLLHPDGDHEALATWTVHRVLHTFRSTRDFSARSSRRRVPFPFSQTIVRALVPGPG